MQFAKSLMTKYLNPAAMDAFVSYWYNTAYTITRVSLLSCNLPAHVSSVLLTSSQ